jgi:hypothetical protein
MCSDGLIDLGLDTPGMREIHPDGVFEVNPLFRNFEKDKTVTGYGISSPGRFYQRILARRSGGVTSAELEADLTPMSLGFYTTLVLEAAEQSLADGKPMSAGCTIGTTIGVKDLLVRQLGDSAAKSYGID